MGSFLDKLSVSYCAYLLISGGEFPPFWVSADDIPVSVVEWTTSTPIPEKFAVYCDLAETCDERFSYCDNTFKICKSCGKECHPEVLGSANHDLEAEETRCDRLCGAYYKHRGKKTDSCPVGPLQECPSEEYLKKIFLSSTVIGSSVLTGVILLCVYLAIKAHRGKHNRRLHAQVSDATETQPMNE